MTTYVSAIDSIFSQFLTGWKAQVEAIVGYEPEIHWPGLLMETPSTLDRIWVKVFQYTRDESQSSFRTGSFGNTYASKGTIYIQIFYPLSDASSITLSRQLAELARNTLRGKKTSANVWFRNARIKEPDPVSPWGSIISSAEYRYTETT